MTIIKINNYYQAVMVAEANGAQNVFLGRGTSHTEALNEAFDAYYQYLAR